MSAGYIIYSLDTEKFRDFVERPTPAQLKALGGLLADGLEALEGEFDEDDPILGWKTDAKSLAKTAAERLARLDWYADLSSTGKELWESVIFDACMDNDDFDVGFRCENDGIYWDVIELAWKKLKVPPAIITDTALSAFGTRPFRYFPVARPAQAQETGGKSRKELKAELEDFSKKLDQMKADILQGRKNLDDLVNDFHITGLGDLFSDSEIDGLEDWTPMHSMHSADEARRMLDELKSIEPTLLTSKKKGVRQQYQDDLLPALQRIADEGRMLFVQVDT